MTHLKDKPCTDCTRLVLFFVSFTFFFSCSNKDQEQKAERQQGIKIAKAFDRDIYSSEIGQFSKKDSVQLTEMYINKIGQEEALLKKAIESGLVDMDEVEEKTSRFRNTLISIRYEKELIKQKLDTNISEEEIKNYYDQNLHSLLLENDIFSGYFIKIHTNTPKIGHLKELMKSNKPQDWQEMRSYCLRYASLFSIDQTQWNLIPKQFNISQHSARQSIQNKEVLSVEKEENMYLVRLFDYKFAKQPSPLSFSKEKIKHILLNKKKMQLLGQNREQLLNEAKSNKYIEIY
jgi:hypothetical protein